MVMGTLAYNLNLALSHSTQILCIHISFILMTNTPTYRNKTITTTRDDKQATKVGGESICLRTILVILRLTESKQLRQPSTNHHQSPDYEMSTWTYGLT